MNEEFDFMKGKQRAERGMEEAASAKRVHEWQHDAGKWFMSLPTGTNFTADDLTMAVGLPDEGPNRNNVVGAFINGLASSKMIKWTGGTVKSERVDRHTGMIRVWTRVR